MEDQTIIQNSKKKKETFLKEKAVLLILSSQELGTSYIIDTDEVVIGRDPSCTIRLQDPEVSSIHCRISVPEEKTFILEDMESTNGTFLNKKPVTKPTQIFYSDRLVLGKTVLRFFLEESLSDSV
ncbi:MULTISPECIES: FHA domain-containing protein [unclassified Oceanispirochaeta]|uniref:FHA domain-containing protein n=1 Tax=unclassified Oceanispirochaeta TaxID=2635722 RepID=UPI000E0932A0|nr:FHA domain-containing protein [Oceanispirochaeta sp. M1]MBF9015210.1 FHA domain-containing protein [Oceanispirochaeta sp. M2]NPD71668.1 FHA domain-containing protein [Oceanispirochaeta sp. M1]RDG32865.1 FHA domain-containing protein [Oceanispirochaeta sp. M1]